MANRQGQDQWGQDQQGQEDQQEGQQDIWEQYQRGEGQEGQQDQGEQVISSMPLEWIIPLNPQPMHPKVSELLSDRMPIRSYRLLLLVILPGPAKKFFPARVNLTPNEFTIEFDQQRHDIRHLHANYLWKIKTGNWKEPVVLRFVPGDIAALAITATSLTLFFTIREPNDHFCSVLVLTPNEVVTEQHVPLMTAFSRSLARWNFPNDNRLMRYGPKEVLPACEWLMDQASTRYHDLPEEESITYDSELYYLYNREAMQLSVVEAMYKHIKYELKKGLIIVAHRLLNRLRLLREQYIQQQLDTFGSNFASAFSINRQPVDTQTLVQDFNYFRQFLEHYRLFYSEVYLNWDDPAVDNSASQPLPPLLPMIAPDGTLMNIARPEHVYLETPYQCIYYATDVVDDPRQPRMLLYSSVLNRWSVVARIEFDARRLIIHHWDELAPQCTAPNGTPLEFTVNYTLIKYFRYSGVGQSVTSFSMHLKQGRYWGYAQLECRDAHEINLIHSLLWMRLHNAQLNPKYIENVPPRADLLATLFPGDPNRWQSPTYGYIQGMPKEQKSKDCQKSKDGQKTKDENPADLNDNDRAATWITNKNLEVFTCRLVNKLAIVLCRRLLHYVNDSIWAEGRDLIDPETMLVWDIYWQYRNVLIPASNQTTLPHIVQLGPELFRMPYRWWYALFDAPNEY